MPNKGVAHYELFPFVELNQNRDARCSVKTMEDSKIQVFVNEHLRLMLSRYANKL